MAVAKINSNLYIGNTGYSLGEIINSGSNSNGKWIKFGDGTMICYRTINFGTLQFKNTWGVLYETDGQNIGNFPMPFVNNNPDIYVMPHGAYFVEKNSSPSLTSWGYCWLVRPDNVSREIILSCFAIGKWR